MRISDWIQTCALPISQGGDDDDGAAGLLLGGESNLSGSDWLLALFGTLGVIGAIAILVSGKSSGENPRRPTEEPDVPVQSNGRSEEHTSELQSLMSISYAVFCLKKKIKRKLTMTTNR